MAPVCTSSEINLLVYHYLKESGFNHACFSLRHEGRLDDDPLSKQAIIEPGRLIRVLQKGLLYLAVESHVNPDGTERPCSAPFRLVGPPHVCDGIASESLAPEPSGLRSLSPEPASIPSRREAAAQTMPVRLAEASTSTDHAANGAKRKDHASPAPSTEDRGEKRARREAPEGENGVEAAADADTSIDSARKGPPRSRTHTPEPPIVAAPGKKKKKKAAPATSETSKLGSKNAARGPSAPPASGKGKEPASLSYPAQNEDGKHFSSDQVQILAGHSAEVFVSAWNPTVPDLVASGAGDATVRIWDLTNGEKRENAAEAVATKTVCKHLPSTQAKDVTALDWNPDGTLLASGSYDGILRLWTPGGDLHLVMSMHQGPIFSVRWNRKGTHLLTGSQDSTAIVWDLSSGKVRQQYALHSDSVLDVDWLSAPKAASSKNAAAGSVDAATLATQDGIFATCSADNSINLLKLGESKPLRMFKGHTDDVNAIAFDHSRSLLASASDDMTAKVWQLDQGMIGSGPSGSSRGRSPSALRKRASPDASGRKSGAMDLDGLDSETGEDGAQDSLPSLSSKSSKGLKFTLAGHTRELYALAWCPSGPGSANPSEPRMLATSAFDHTARIWNADDGSCLRVISDHTDSVYSLAFSDDARFLVTGGIDQLVLITKIADGTVAKHFKTGGAVLDVQWHTEGKGKSNGALPSPVKKERSSSETKSLVNGKRAGNSNNNNNGSSRTARLSVAQQNKVLTVLSLDDLDA